MATWTVNPSDGVTGTGPSFTFPANTGATDKVYTITYADDNGCTASTTYTIPSCPIQDCTQIWSMEIINSSSYKSTTGTTAIYTFFVWRNGVKVTDLGSSDFIIEINFSGQGNLSCDIYHPAQDANVPYILRASGSLCDDVGKTATLGVSLSSCPDVGVSSDIVIGNYVTYTVKLNSSDANVTGVTAALNFNHSGCSSIIRQNNIQTTINGDGSVSMIDSATSAQLVGLAVNSGIVRPVTEADAVLSSNNKTITIYYTGNY